MGYTEEQMQNLRIAINNLNNNLRILNNFSEEITRLTNAIEKANELKAYELHCQELIEKTSKSPKRR